MRIPDPRPWWPNGLGDPNLYRLTLSIDPGDGTASDTCTTTFGLRTIAMRPLPGGPRPNLYNWTFVINGRETFLKGTGWCTMDAAMNFSRDRYARFLNSQKISTANFSAPGVAACRRPTISTTSATASASASCRNGQPHGTATMSNHSTPSKKPCA